MNVGFIGLGQMGTGMAANLLRAGHSVTVYNRTASKHQELVHKGAHAADQVADACRGEAVITMLADDSALEDMAYGEKGLIKNMKKDAVHICMATISVSLSKRLALRHAEAGHGYVAAPVFGRRMRQPLPRSSLWPQEKKIPLINVSLSWTPWDRRPLSLGFSLNWPTW